MLPETWIESLFARLAVRYGAAWARQWAGLDPEAIKLDWRRALAGFADWPEAIAHALEHLPTDRPPNAQQFRDLTRNAPRKPVPQLPAPESDPQRLSEAMHALAQAKSTPSGSGGPRAWAQRLQARERAGERLTPYQRTAYREALGLEGDACR